MVWLDKFSFAALIIMAVALGLAPFTGQAHLVQKLHMLVAGDLYRPIDVFDLFMHGAGIILLALKIIRTIQVKSKA